MPYKDKERKKEYHRELYKKNIEKERLRSRNYYNKNKESQKIAASKWRENNKDKVKMFNKKWNENNKEKVLIKAKKYRNKYPKKIKAHTIAQKIPLNKNCEICKDEKRLERHHWDYNQPLKINTLCKSCHTIQHIKHFSRGT